MKKILFPSFVALLLMMTSCEQVVPPVLGALEVEVSSERISCSVEVVEGTIDDCGFYYSTSKASVMNNKVTPVPGGCSYGTIQGEIVGLSPNTTYYLKAYGMNEKGQGQTEVKQVRTFSRKPNMEDNQYPDKVE